MAGKKIGERAGAFRLYWPVPSFNDRIIWEKGHLGTLARKERQNKSLRGQLFGGKDEQGTTIGQMGKPTSVNPDRRPQASINASES